MQFGEARLRMRRDRGKLTGIPRPGGDLLDRLRDKVLGRKDAAARDAEEIADAAAVGGDDRYPRGNGVVNDQRLGLVLIGGREQENVDILIEAPDVERRPR